MVRLFAAGFALAMMLGTVVADDKKDSKDKSAVVSWERETNGIDLKLDVAKDTLKIHVFAGENGAIVSCKMTADKDGMVKAKITEVEEKGSFPAKPKIGTEFTFKWKVDGDKATLSEFTAEGLDEAKPIMEGEYSKKK